VSSADVRGRRVDKPFIHLSVPKKIVRLATERNRLKRLLREAIRGEAHFLAPGIHLIKVTVRPVSANLAVTKTELAEALNRVKKR
jgi:ribonuclease P protein component